jgi:hypothetical protein
VHGCEEGEEEVREIYIVVGTAGQYDERTEWVVCAYANAELAEQHAKRAQRSANRIGRAQRLWRENRMGRWPPEDTTWFSHFGDPRAGANLYDPNMQFPDSPNYHVECVPFPVVVERLPHEPHLPPNN